VDSLSGVSIAEHEDRSQPVERRGTGVSPVLPQCLLAQPIARAPSESGISACGLPRLGAEAFRVSHIGQMPVPRLQRAVNPLHNPVGASESKRALSVLFAAVNTQPGTFRTRSRVSLRGGVPERHCFRRKNLHQTRHLVVRCQIGGSPIQEIAE
jgi:hypothetical protein